MTAILVRIGIDHAYGAWNAPVHPVTGQFVYVPIPDNTKKQYASGNAHEFDQIVAPLSEFAERHAAKDLRYPMALHHRYMHLDPDFDYLTYGDNGMRRGARIATLGPNDLVVFYAGLRSILDPNELVYALAGLFVVEKVVRAIDVPVERRYENAHTRWTTISEGTPMCGWKRSDAPSTRSPRASARPTRGARRKPSGSRLRWSLNPWWFSNRRWQTRDAPLRSAAPRRATGVPARSSHAAPPGGSS